MKNLIDYISERFISSKNTLFSTQHVLFVPYSACLNYMEQHKNEYEKYMIEFVVADLCDFTLFLIPRYKAKEIYDSLPYKNLSVDSQTNNLGIYKLPNDIYDKEQLIKTLQEKRCVQIMPVISHNDKLWERITNIDNLK